MNENAYGSALRGLRFEAGRGRKLEERQGVFYAVGHEHNIIEDMASNERMGNEAV